jgi:transcriptional regulator with XRE-family HTH domain
MREYDFLHIFSDNLRYSLHYANMTQRELADAIGIDESVISRYLRGQRMPTIKTIVNMACVLDCDISDLVPCDELVF